MNARPKSKERETTRHEQKLEEVLPGGKMRRAAARQAEKRFKKISRERSPGDMSDISNEFSDDSEDNFDLSKEISSKTMYKLQRSKSGEKIYRCLVCTGDYPSKDKIDGHLIQEHAKELFSNQDVDSEDEYNEKEDKSKLRKSLGQPPPKLDPNPIFMEREAKFRRENFSVDLLPWVNSIDSKTTILQDETEYFPSGSASTRFEVGKDSPAQSLKRFESSLKDGSSVIYTGGPVWAMAWVPQPTPSTTQYLAVSTHSSDRETRYDSASTEPGFIQLWRFDVSKAQELCESPKLVLGLGHSYGKVWGLEWCPSGAWENSITFGCLAAACSDGSVRIFKVKFPKKGRKFLKYEVDKTLIPCSDGQGQCLSLSWYRGPGHRYLAASFISGLVAIWDLGSSSSLLSSEAGSLPITSWFAHNSSTTAISFSTSEFNYPRYCVTGGSDRTYRFWDLRDTCTPIQEVKRGMVTAVTWLPGQPAAAVSHDDVYLQAHTQTLVTESGFNRSGSQPIVGQNSCVWDQSVSSWLGGLALCTAAGELIVYVMPDGNKSVDQNRSSLRRRAYVYLTRKVVDEPSSNQKDDAISQNHIKYYDLWNSEGLLDTERIMRDSVRYSEKMETEDLLSCPTCSVNRVDWNPNLGGHLLVASGGQAGLVRVHALASLNTNAIKSVAEKIPERKSS